MEARRVMVAIRMLLDEATVNAYLKEHGLMEGFSPVDAVLLQQTMTEGGEPGAMIVVKLGDGSRVLTKITLKQLDIVAKSLRAAMEGITEREAANSGKLN